MRSDMFDASSLNLIVPAAYRDRAELLPAPTRASSEWLITRARA